MNPYPRRWQALAVLAVSLLVISVGNTILNVALPTIQEELDASSSELQWIVDGYMLVYAGLLLAAGTLGDRFGRRKALVTGLLTFALGSVFAALSGGATELIASRALMGVGAAAIMPTTLSILTNVFPDDERPKAIAIWAAVAGLGVAIGPISGGWMIEHMSYTGIFLFNLPAVAVCLIGALALVPESRDPESPRLDWMGVGLSIAGLTAVVWGLIEAPERGWTEPVILAAFAGGAAILAAFVAWERRVEQPMLQVSVFRNLRFSAASASITFVYFSLMGVMYFMTTYLQSVIGFGVSTGDLELSLVLGLMGAGIGLAMSPATEAIMGSLPKAKAGIGSAMNDVVREVGGTLGIAVLGSILATSYASSMEGPTAALPADAAAAASDSVGAAHAVAAQTGATDLVATANQAFVDAMSTTAGIAAAIAIVGAVVAAAFLPARAKAPRPTLAAEAAAA